MDTALDVEAENYRVEMAKKDKELKLKIKLNKAQERKGKKDVNKNVTGVDEILLKDKNNTDEVMQDTINTDGHVDEQGIDRPIEITTTQEVANTIQTVIKETIELGGTPFIRRDGGKEKKTNKCVPEKLKFNEPKTKKQKVGAPAKACLKGKGKVCDEMNTEETRDEIVAEDNGMSSDSDFQPQRTRKFPENLKRTSGESSKSGRKETKKEPTGLKTRTSPKTLCETIRGLNEK